MRMRFTATTTGMLVLLAGLGVGTGWSWGKTGARRPADHVQVRVPGRALGAALPYFERATQLRITGDPELLPLRFLAYGERVSARELLRRIAALLKIECLEASDGAVRLRARVPGRAAQRAARARRYEEERVAELRRQLQDTLALPRDPRDRARIELVLALPTTRLERVLQGDPYLSPPLKELPAAERDRILLATGLDRPETAGLGGVRCLIDHRSLRGLGFVMVGAVGLQDRSVTSRCKPVNGMQTKHDFSRYPLTVEALRRFAPPGAERAALLQRRVRLPPARAAVTWAARRHFATLPDLLQDLSAATGLPVLCDYFGPSRDSASRRKYPELPLWQLLTAIGEQYELDWSWEGGWIQFRHRYWWELEAADIPEERLSPWVGAGPLSTEKRVSREAFLSVLRTLRPAQIADLERHAPGTSLAGNARMAIFLGTLDEQQARLAVQGGALPYHAMRPDQ